MNHAPPRKSIQRVDNRKGKPPRLSIKDLMSLNGSNAVTPENQSRRKSYYLPQQSPAERSAYQSSTIEGFSPTMKGTTPKGLSMVKVDSSETRSVMRPHRGSEIYSQMGTEIFDDNKEMIIKILGKPSERRSRDEISLLQKSFADIQFFKKTEQELEPHFYKMLFKNLKLETFQPGQRVFNHGDEGNKFYIIIQGAVYILLKKKGIIEQDPASVQNVPDRFIKGFNEEGLTNEKKIRKVEDHYPGFWVARVMKDGESFGDIALQVSGDRTRTATVVCKESTLFGVLSFDDYQFSLGTFPFLGQHGFYLSSIGRLFEKKYGEKIDFLATINLFQHWSITQISALLMNMEEHKYQRKQIIFREGEDSQNIYFVLNGEVELWKKVDIEEKSSTLMIRPNSQAPVSPNRLKAIKKKKDMRLAVIMTGQYFGASGITDEKPREYSAVVSVSDTRLLSLHKEKFFTLVKDRQSLKRLAAHIMQKEVSRENRTMNYVNINTYYGSFADHDKSPPIPILPELSPKNWPDLNSFKNADTVSPHKGLKFILTPTRPKLLPSLSHNSSEITPKSKSTKKLTRNQTSSSPPPSIYKSEADEFERFKILNFEQKSLLQKKSEFNQSYAKLQRKLTKMLDAKDQEAATNFFDASEQGQVDQEDDCSYELNFVRNGKTSQGHSPLGLQTLVAETVESNYSATEENSHWLPSPNKALVSPHRRKIRSHLHESLKYKLIKKLGIDKLYQSQTESSEILPTQGSFQSEIPQSPTVIKFKAVGPNNVQSPRSSTNSGILKKMQNRSFNFNSASSEVSRLSFHSQNRSQIGSNNGSRIVEKKASKSIYGKIHQIIGSNK